MLIIKVFALAVSSGDLQWVIYFVERETDFQTETIGYGPGKINFPTTWNAISLGPFYEISGNLTLATVRDYRELVNQARELSKTHRFIIIDAPPRIAEMTRAIIVMSSLCLVPLGASAAEIWSTADLLQTIKAARQFRPDIDVRIVWNRFRGHTREALEVSEAAREELGLQELNSRLGYRVAYSEALARGLSVDEWLDRTAHAEIVALANEVQGLLKEK